MKHRKSALRRRYGRAGGAEPVHFLTDWRYVACRKAEQRGTIHGSRNPSEVTCPKCMKAQPHQFDPIDLAYARVIHTLPPTGLRGKKRDAVVEWIHAAGGPEVVLRMSPLKIREGVGAYLGW